MRVRNSPNDRQRKQLRTGDADELVEKDRGEDNLDNGQHQGGCADSRKPVFCKVAVTFVSVLDGVDARDVAGVWAARVHRGAEPQYTEREQQNCTEPILRESRNNCSGNKCANQDDVGG